MDQATIFHTVLSLVPVGYLVDVAALCGVCAAVMPWLPLPGSAQSPYGRFYAVLNLAAQNFRNVANLAQPGRAAVSCDPACGKEARACPAAPPEGRDGGTRRDTPPVLGLAVAGMLLAGGLALSGCGMPGGTVAIDAAELAADAGAVAFAAEAIEAVPGLAAHLTADQAVSVQQALAQIRAVTAEINAASAGAASAGTIALETGKGWASALVSAFRTMLAIAAPVVASCAPAVAPYIQTAEQIIPVLEQVAGLTQAVPMRGSVPAAAIRAALYRGP